MSTGRKEGGKDRCACRSGACEGCRNRAGGTCRTMRIMVGGKILGMWGHGWDCVKLLFKSYSRVLQPVHVYNKCTKQAAEPFSTCPAALRRCIMHETMTTLCSSAVHPAARARSITGKVLDRSDRLQKKYLHRVFPLGTQDTLKGPLVVSSRISYFAVE